MTDSETTFTVEVLGFASGADPETLAASVAEFFGISIEEGRRLVKKRPIRVKRKAPAAIAQQLVKQLRRLGADVLVRNEQSGEERAYHAKGSKAAQAPRDAEGPPGEPISSRESIPGSQPFGPIKPDLGPVSRQSEPGEGAPGTEETLESDDGDAPPEPPPSVEVVSARDTPEVVSARDTPDPAPSSGDKAARASVPSVPGARVSDADDARSTPVSQPEGARSSKASDPGSAAAAAEPAAAGEPEAAPRPSGPSTSAPSLPPPSAPILGLPPATTGKIDFCGSCNRPVERGEICSRCGWNNADMERHCRQCKKKLSLVSMVTRSVVATALFSVAVLAIAAAVVVLFGVSAGVSAVALCGGLVVLADALTLRYSCKTCTVAVYSERLQKEETKRISAARRKGLALSGVAAVGAIAFFAGSGASARAMSDSSYGIAWKLEVPGTHSHVTSEVTQIVTPTGSKRARVQFAERPFVGGATYFLVHYQHTFPSGSTEPDKVGVQDGAKQLVKGYFAGQMSGELQPMGDAFQGSFSGTFHNRPVSGRLRVAQYEHDVVVVVVTSGSESDLRDASVDHLLGSVSVQRDAK